MLLTTQEKAQYILSDKVCESSICNYHTHCKEPHARWSIFGITILETLVMFWNVQGQKGQVYQLRKHSTFSKNMNLAQANLLIPWQGNLQFQDQNCTEFSINTSICTLTYHITCKQITYQTQLWRCIHDGETRCES
jgi:hypothetical protein